MKNSDELFTDFRRLLLVYYGLKYNLLQTLGESPTSIDSLAEISGIPSDRLVRLIRGLCWAKIITNEKDELFSNTEAGEYYLSKSYDILFQGDFFLRQWTYFDAYFEKGENPYQRAKDELIFDSLSKDPRLGQVFASPWALRTKEYASAIATHTVFEEASVVIDLGGAEGTLLDEILAIHTQLKGICFDLPYCESSFREQNFKSAERLTFLAGSFFESIPPNGDVYILKWVLHDWDDQHCVKILNTISKELENNSKLLIIERVMPSNFSESIPLAQADLNMLALNSGKERTQDDYANLLEDCGLALASCSEFENDYGFCVIEATLKD